MTEENNSENQLSNPYTCNLTVGDRVYGGNVKFMRFDFSTWRRWRKVIVNKKQTAKLKKSGFDTIEQESITSYWSGAALIDEWDVYYTDGDGNKFSVDKPEVGVIPSDELDFQVFTWFRYCASSYISPLLGISPNS